MPLIRVVEPGLLSTVQDLGRPGYADLGVSSSGAADPLSLRLGNLLVGNTENAAALEMTLAGGTFEFDGVALIALSGSDFGSTLDGTPVPAWIPFEVTRGQLLHCGKTRAGARCYLCVHGGIDVPLVLGSASTHLLTSMGGFKGRALRSGDVLHTAEPDSPRFTISKVHPQHVAARLARDLLRVTPGPQVEWFSCETRALFTNETYTVGETSDRMGLRLNGAPLILSEPTEMITEGVALGAIQIPPDGQPILLWVEHQTTGGYPKIANVISADLPRAGQLRPQDQVRFQFVDFQQAAALLRQQEEWIYSLVQVH